MLGLLHRIAMVQLSPAHLATTWPPLSCGCVNWRAPYADGYSALLSDAVDWSQRITDAPDRRMGVEMTLLRALAFHHVCLCLSQKCHASPLRPSRHGSNDANPGAAATAISAAAGTTVPLPETTSQVLAARQQLQACREQPKQKRVNRQPLPARGGE